MLYYFAMAKTLENFKKEYQGLEEKALKYIHGFGQFETSNNNARSFINSGAVELGLRVQVLKDKGATGTKIEDFIGDKEVKTGLGEIDAMVNRRESELEKMLQQKTKAEDVIQSAKKLQGELQKEIAARKKQLTTKLGIGNKSLPGMVVELEKLAKALASGGVFDKLDDAVQALDEPGEWESLRDLQIKLALSKTKNAAINENQRVMLKQLMDARHVATVLGSVKALAQEFAAAGKLAKAAKQGKKTSDLKRYKADAASAAKKVVAAVAPLETAVNDGWVAPQLREANAKALTVVPQMITIRDSVLRESLVIAAL